MNGVEELDYCFGLAPCAGCGYCSSPKNGPELIAELDRQLVAMHTLNQKQAETIARKDRIIATLQREVARLKAEIAP